MAAHVKGTKVAWYRVPVGRENLSALNRKSNVKGSVQTIGFLAILATTATGAYLSVGRLPWYAVAALLFINGTCWCFLVNGFHELIHNSVFSSKSANRFFLYIFSFLGWLNPVFFWASHTEHHKYTLHPPDDLEVTLPTRLTVGGFLKVAIVNPESCFKTIYGTARVAAGRFQGEWENHLFPESDPELRRRMVNWSRILLVGHGVIFIVAGYFHLWMLPVVTSLAPFYGGGLQYLCNNAQHTGLSDNVPDFRLCCRTIYLNPVVEFLYWHMNYHTEHHMYAGVPCYNLSRLHKLVKDSMPACPRGLAMTWRGIAAILEKQKLDPNYQFVAAIPSAKAYSPMLEADAATS